MARHGRPWRVAARVADDRSPSSPPRSPAATSRSSPTARSARSRSARSGCRSTPATAARSTSTCRSSTGARASRRSGCPSACAPTSAPSTASSCSGSRTAPSSTSTPCATRRATRSPPTCAALIALMTVCALALGLLTAFAVRHRVGPKLRYTVAAAAHHRARRRDRVRRADPAARGDGHAASTTPTAPTSRARSTPSRPCAAPAEALDQELDAQLVGLARLVNAPAGRTPVEGSPRVTIASDLHNNVISLPILERTAGDGPVFFPGDLSDRGSPLETALVARVAEIGRPFVFVTGNHDSDRSAQELADDGAVVLTAARPAQARRRLRAGDQRDRRHARRGLLRPVPAPRVGELPRPLRARADAGAARGVRRLDAAARRAASTPSSSTSRR